MSDSLSDQLQTSLGSAFTLERELGGGGMSRVFLATETALDRQVVIKLLPPELAASVSIERFKREIQLAARLQHAHIVPLLSAGESDGLPYFTMPYVEGESLRARLALRGEMPVAEAVRVLREIASALAYAHERRVVHRDIKPDNILLSGGAAMVTDFGVAKALVASSNTDDGVIRGEVTSLGVALGTPAYMAPEQASADPNVDHRADVYAFGILAYELLTGQTPFAGRTPQGLLAAHVTEPPEPIQKRRGSIPPALAALVMRCLEKRPADRPQTATEIVHALDDLATPSGGMPPTFAASGGEAPASVPSSGKRRSRVAALTALVLGILVVGGGAAAWRRWTSAPSAAAPDTRSVAVLPFENIGSDTSNLYFSDGMTDEVMTALGRIPKLRVASRGSAFSFKGKNVDAREIGRTLGVTHVVEGSVRRIGGRLRLSARLVSTANNYEVWSDSYDRDLTDVFAVQDELARAIAKELDASLGGAPLVSTPHGTNNLEAYDLYLKGRYLWNHRTTAALDQAMQAFSEAIRLDSSYALAYAALGDVFSVYPQYAQRPPREYIERARRSAERALSLDSTLSEAHATLGILGTHYQHDAEAEREFKRSIAMKPDYATAHHWYALLLRNQGRLPESLVEIQKARTLDPLSPIIATLYATAFYYARDYPRAIRELQQVLGANPGFAEANRFLARSYAEAGDFPHALETVRAISTISGREEYADLGWILGKMENRPAAESLLAVVRQRAAHGYVPNATFAMIHLGLGNRDSVIVWLNRAADDLEPVTTYPLRADPRFDPMRTDRRFSALEARVTRE